VKENKQNLSRHSCFPIHFYSFILNTYFFVLGCFIWLENEKAWMATSLSPSSGTYLLLLLFLFIVLFFSVLHLYWLKVLILSGRCEGGGCCCISGTGVCFLCVLCSFCGEEVISIHSDGNLHSSCKRIHTFPYSIFFSPCIFFNVYFHYF
jgi:hypothetical protein